MYIFVKKLNDMNTFDEHNKDNPANWIDQLESFESDNIAECLDHYKDFNDCEPLENAIMKQETLIENLISELTFLIDSNPKLKNKLQIIKSKLITTQIKRYND
jgi:hypothetical protein